MIDFGGEPADTEICAVAASARRHCHGTWRLDCDRASGIKIIVSDPPSLQESPASFSCSLFLIFTIFQLRQLKLLVCWTAEKSPAKNA